MDLRTAGLFVAALAALTCGTSREVLAANSPGCTAVAAQAPVTISLLTSQAVFFNQSKTANFWYPVKLSSSVAPLALSPTA
jgi:hypothetical protein